MSDTYKGAGTAAAKKEEKRRNSPGPTWDAADQARHEADSPENKAPKKDWNKINREKADRMLSGDEPWDQAFVDRLKKGNRTEIALAAELASGPPTPEEPAPAPAPEPETVARESNKPHGSSQGPLITYKDANGEKRNSYQRATMSDKERATLSPETLRHLTDIENEMPVITSKTITSPEEWEAYSKNGARMGDDGVWRADTNERKAQGWYMGKDGEWHEHDANSLYRDREGAAKNELQALAQQEAELKAQLDEIHQKMAGINKQRVWPIGAKFGSAVGTRYP
jgi:hypothetical protein